MLSLELCRTYYDVPVSDEDLQTIRNHLTVLADLLIEQSDIQAFSASNQFDRVTERLPEDDREAIEERIAIRTESGGMPLDTAERLTLTEYSDGRKCHE